MDRTPEWLPVALGASAVGLLAVAVFSGKSNASSGAAAPGDAPVPDGAPPESFADALLEAAYADLGAAETTPNGGPRVDEMLRNVGLPTGYNWCAAAVATWMREASDKLGVPMPIAGSAGALNTMNQFEDSSNARVSWVPAAQLRQDPSLVRPGMVPVFNRGAAGSGMGHIDIVTSTDGLGAFGTIDGNSGPASDRVAENQRHLSDQNLIGMGVVIEAQTEPAGTGYQQDPPGVLVFPRVAISCCPRRG